MLIHALLFILTFNMVFSCMYVFAHGGGGGEATNIQLILTISLRLSTYKSIYLNVEPATLQFS